MFPCQSLFTHRHQTVNPFRLCLASAPPIVLAERQVTPTSCRCFQASYAGLALIGGFFAYKMVKGDSLDTAARDLKVGQALMLLVKSSGHVCCIAQVSPALSPRLV